MTSTGDVPTKSGTGKICWIVCGVLTFVVAIAIGLGVGLSWPNDCKKETLDCPFLDEKLTTRAFNKGWTELTDEERASASIMGYDECMWFNSEIVDTSYDYSYGASSQTSCDSENSVEERDREDVEDRTWQEFTSTEKEAAEALGFTRRLWNGEALMVGRENCPSCIYVAWGHLTEAEQKAAEELQLTSTSWDRKSGYYSNWVDLTAEETAGATKLGFDQTSWDDSSSATNPASNDKYWEQLNSEEKAAALSVGYHESGCDWDNTCVYDTPWRVQTAEVKKRAFCQLGWDNGAEDPWNYPASVYTEQRMFDQLGDSENHKGLTTSNGRTGKRGNVARRLQSGDANHAHADAWDEA